MHTYSVVLGSDKRRVELPYTINNLHKAKTYIQEKYGTNYRSLGIIEHKWICVNETEHSFDSNLMVILSLDNYVFEHAALVWTYEDIDGNRYLAVKNRHDPVESPTPYILGIHDTHSDEDYFRSVLRDLNPSTVQKVMKEHPDMCPKTVLSLWAKEVIYRDRRERATFNA